MLATFNNSISVKNSSSLWNQFGDFHRHARDLHIFGLAISPSTFLDQHLLTPSNLEGQGAALEPNSPQFTPSHCGRVSTVIVYSKRSSSSSKTLPLQPPIRDNTHSSNGQPRGRDWHPNGIQRGWPCLFSPATPRMASFRWKDRICHPLRRSTSIVHEYWTKPDRLVLSNWRFISIFSHLIIRYSRFALYRLEWCPG